jgi:hypothetical protein
MDKRKSVYLLLVWLSLSWPGSADKLQVQNVNLKRFEFNSDGFEELGWLFLVNCVCR